MPKLGIDRWPADGTVERRQLLPQAIEAAEREVDALWTRIGKLLDAFTTDECAAYLRHAGHAAN
jgi:hypothetical protein